MAWVTPGKKARYIVVERFDTPIKARNYGCRITERTSLGYLSALVIENEKLRITVLAGRGADVVEFLYKPKDMDFAWLTFTGVRGNAIDSDAPGQLDSFMDEYPGGWQTIFPNGGEPSEYNGVAMGQHAEISVVPWSYEILEDTPEKASIKFTVFTKRFPYKVEKTLTITTGSSRCELIEKVTNLSDQTLQAMWGEHFTFGPPFLDTDSKVIIEGGGEVIPHHNVDQTTPRRIGSEDRFAWPIGTDKDGNNIDFSQLPPHGTTCEMLYVHKMVEGKYRVVSPNKNLAAEVKWDNSVFPYLWYWQEYGATKGDPWYGNHYNIGLEPFSSYSTSGISDALANGTALTFAPHSEKVQALSFEVFEI